MSLFDVALTIIIGVGVTAAFIGWVALQKWAKIITIVCIVCALPLIGWSSFMHRAEAQTVKQSSSDNQGIITEGQKGNNTIINQATPKTDCPPGTIICESDIHNQMITGTKFINKGTGPSIDITGASGVIISNSIFTSGEK